MLKIVRCFSVTSLKKTVFTPACQRSWNGDPSYHLLLRRYMPLTALCQRWAHSRHNENWQCDVTDPEWAGHIANTVLQHVDESQTVLHECYPGPGLVTDHLLASRRLNVMAWEPRTRYSQQLESLWESYPDRLDVVERSLLRSWSPDELRLLLGSAVTRPDDSEVVWEDSPKMSVFGLLPSSHLRSYMMSSTIAMANGVFPFHQGRTQCFFYLAEKYHKILLSAPHVNQQGRFPAAVLLMYLLYDVNTLMKIPEGAFTVANQKKGKDKDSGDFYLVKLVPKADLFQSVCPPDLLVKLMYFVNHICWKQYSRLIPWIEQVAPGRGLQMVKDGHSMLEVVGDLNADHIPALFQDLVAHHGLLESEILSESGGRNKSSREDDLSDDEDSTGAALHDTGVDDVRNAS